MEAMDHEELIAVIGEAWSGDGDLRVALEAATRDGCWTHCDDQSLFFSRDWTKDDDSGVTIEIASKGVKAQIPMSQHRWPIVSKQWGDNVDDDGYFCIEDDDDNPKYGCEECGASGSHLRAVLETNRRGDMRLRVTEKVFCRCLSRYGEPLAEEYECLFVPLKTK